MSHLSSIHPSPYSLTLYVTCRTGTPQVILGVWCDTYDYAVRAEWLGVGIWGNRHAAPFWTGDEVARAVLTIISPGAEGERYRQRARELATPSRAQSGRVVAAREIVRAVERYRNRNGTQGRVVPIDEIDEGNGVKRVPPAGHAGSGSDEL